MSDLKVTKTRFTGGTWEGVVTGAPEDKAPAIEVTLDQEALSGVQLDPLVEGGHLLRVPVPAEAIGDGIRVFVIRDAGDGTTLGQFAVIAGEPADDSMAAELALLRAELDLLKRAFRRHCVETV